MAVPAFTFEFEGGKVEFSATIVAGKLIFSYETILTDPDVRIDLNGFFLDFGGDGGSVKSVGSIANNMNGGNNDGYDFGKVLGSVGGNDEDNRAGSFEIDLSKFSFPVGTDLTDVAAVLAGADAGLRATSFGPDGELSLKLVDDYTPPVDDHFPELEQNISNVLFYFKDKGEPTDTDANGDGYILIKIDDVPDAASDDLDDWYGDVLAFLKSEKLIDDDDELLGVAIKGGGGPGGSNDAEFFELDGDTDADPFPAGFGTINPGGNADVALIDESILYADIF
ncbi:MAG: hypothetical protein Q8M31_01615 [Beijerinckiaceae bacterium]|nr:hypothetical protein [Beijerinckiaceae bacterium]